MSNTQCMRLLAVFCMVSGSLIVASEAPSTPSRKRARREVDLYQTPPARQRQRVAPLAPSDKILLGDRERQNLLDRVAESFDTPGWVHRNPVRAAGYLDALYNRLGRNTEAFFHTRTSDDGRSMIFLVSQHSGLRHDQQWIWGKLSRDIKKKEVAYQHPDTGKTLLHYLVEHGNHFAIIQDALGFPQNLLRIDKQGNVAFQCSSTPDNPVIKELATATREQASRAINDANNELPTDLANLISQMLVGSLGLNTK